MRKVFHVAARASDITAGSGLPVEVGGERLVVYRTESGELAASVALCPHQNERLDLGKLEGCEVVCRRHHLRFDLRSGECTNAGGYWLQTFEVRLEDDQVLVGLWEDSVESALPPSGP